MTLTESSIRRINLPFLGSFAVVVLGYLVALAILRLVLPDTEVAATLSALVIGAGPRVQRELERRFPRTPLPAVSIEGYAIRWWLLLVAGAFGIWFAEAARIVISFRGGPATTVSASADAALTLLPVAAALAIGLIAGARVPRWPLMVAGLAIVLGHVAAVATSDRVVAFAVGSEPPPGFSASPPDATPTASPPAGGPPISGPPPGALDPGCSCGPPPDPRPGLFGAGLVGTLLADELPILVLVGMGALWWGTRMRFAFYLGHLAADLPDADRAALASLIIEERGSDIPPDHGGTGTG